MEDINHLKIYITNVVEEITIVKNIDIISLDEKLLDIFQKIDEIGPNITFNSYYISDFELFLNENKFPYILRDNYIEWNVDLNTVTLLDFMRTHNIAFKDGITIETGYPMAGGRGDIFDVIEIWTNAWPIIKNFAPLVIGGVGFLSSSISLVQWIKSFKTNKKNSIPYPYHFFDCIYKRSIWNHYELAKHLDIPVENAKYWLKALLYQWDNSIKAYVISEDDRSKVMSMINSVDRYPNS